MGDEKFRIYVQTWNTWGLPPFISSMSELPEFLKEKIENLEAEWGRWAFYNKYYAAIVRASTIKTYYAGVYGMDSVLKNVHDLEAEAYALGLLPPIMKSLPDGIMEQENVDYFGRIGIVSSPNYEDLTMIITYPDPWVIASGIPNIEKQRKPETAMVKIKDCIPYGYYKNSYQSQGFDSVRRDLTSHESKPDTV